MSDNVGDLRGSTPIYSAKEILQSLDQRVREMDLKMDGALMSLQIMVSQNLNERLVVLEREAQEVHPKALEAVELVKEHQVARRQIEGMGMMLKALFGANFIIFIAAVISIVQNLGVTP